MSNCKKITLLAALPLALAAADLPVKQVTLYKNGVAHYTRSGKIQLGETLRLFFKSGEMNDVLKTLTVVSENGLVKSVRYESSDPLERRLADFGFSVGRNVALSEFLDQFKGRRLELRLAAETLSGTLVSARRIAAAGEQAERQEVLLLQEWGDLRTVDLSTVKSLRFTDGAVQAALARYLGLLAENRGEEFRGVAIETAGTAAGQVAVSYLAPAPVWKSAYRLLLKGDQDAVLEGWAIVDNTTQEDWDSVTLALMSGRPVSFQMNLYEPSYRKRPVVAFPEEEAVQPSIHEGTVSEARAEAAADELRAVKMAPMAGFAAAERVPAPAAPSSIEQNAAAREAGELFEYRMAGLVTIRRGESAMLPFVQKQTAVRRLVIYSERNSPHPRHAVEIINQTGLTLDGGPVTIFDAGSYAGEALMETLKKGDKRLVSYSVDLGTRITTQFGSRTETAREVRFSRGVLRARSAVVESTEYRIRNVDNKPKTLILEHAVRPGMVLREPAQAETTVNGYRFEAQLGPSSERTFRVVEERPLEETYAASNLTPDLLTAFLQNRQLSPAAREGLQRLHAQKQKIAAAGRELTQIENDIRAAGQDVQRVRDNINSLRSVAGQQDQVQKYASQLAALETRIAQLRDRQAEVQRQRSALEAELDNLIEKLEF